MQDESVEPENHIPIRSFGTVLAAAAASEYCLRFGYLSNVMKLTFTDNVQGIKLLRTLILLERG